jgi:hypothetical protein
VSLELLDALGVEPPDSVVDVGGGASPLAGQLLERGFRDVTVLDVSGRALAEAAGSLGARATQVEWLPQDVRDWAPGRRYDAWHDRGAFHFLVAATDRLRYLDVLERAVAPRGAAIIATFAADGPVQCSGLPIARYDPPELAALLGPGFELVAARREDHRTPDGRVQPFAWAALRRRPS